MIHFNFKNTVVCLITSDGQQFYISGGGKAQGNKGVYLLEGVKGFDEIKYKMISSQSARQPGSTYLDKTQDELELDLPFMISGDSSLQFQRRKENFVRALFSGNCKIGFFSLNYGWRWIDCRATSFEENTGKDATRIYTGLYDISFTAFDPRYQGYSEVQSLQLADSIGVTVTNLSDYPAYPILVFKGSGGQTSTIEVPGIDSVTIPSLASENDTVLINSQPSKIRAFSSTRGLIPWHDTAYKRVQLKVEPHQEQKFIINTTNHNEKGELQVVLKHHYHSGY